VPRAALERYGRSQGLTWIEDPSNRSLAPDRNYLRHRVLPLVRERWPAVSATLSRSAAHCAEAAAMIDQLAGQMLPGLEGGHPGALSIPALLCLDLPLRKAVLRLWLRRSGFFLPNAAQLGRILNEVLPARPDAAPLVAWRGCEVRRYRTDLFALPPLPAAPTVRDLAWSGGVLELPGPLGILERVPARTGQRKVAEPIPKKGLAVRFNVSEQCCRPVDSDHVRPMKKLFQERGIPAWLRPFVPLVFDGDRLAAIPGVCSCAGEPDAVGVGARWQIRWTGHPWESLAIFR